MKKPISALAVLFASLTLSVAASAAGSVQHFAQSTSHVGQSAVHSAKSAGNAVVGTTKLVSGVAAVPFKAAGAVGDVSDAIGDALWTGATGKEETPLKVSEKTVTAGPAPMVAIGH